MAELREAQADTDARIATLADAQIHMEEAQVHADARIAALADAQARTNQRVEEFAADVRKYTQIMTEMIRRTVRPKNQPLRYA